MPIDTVLFDLDGTLLDRRATFRSHLELQISRQAAYFMEGAAAYVAELLALDENGTLEREPFYREAERRFGLAPGAAEALQADFEAHFPETCVPFPGVVDVLDHLRTAGFKLGVITNGRVLIQARKIDRLGIRPLLDCVIISEDLGVGKPDARIFARALADLGSIPSAAVFIGDNPDVDVVGAKRSGILAVWKRDPYWTEPAEADLVIGDMGELLPHLETWSHGYQPDGGVKLSSG